MADFHKDGTTLGMACTCVGISPCGVIQNTAKDEKTHLYSLNEKFTSYINKVRSMQSSTSTSSQTHMEIVSVLEDEIYGIKMYYETEIANLRQQIEKLSSEKSSAESEVEQMKLEVGMSKNKHTDESLKIRDMRCEIDRITQLLIVAQKEVAEFRALILIKDRTIRELEPEVTWLRKEYEAFSMKLSAEVTKRKTAENSVKNSSEKKTFDSQTLVLTINDLEERLRASNEIICCLETRVSQMTQSQSSTDVSSLMQKLRASTSSELRRYQQESEEAFNRGLCALRRQIEEEIKTKTTVEKEKNSMEMLVIQLQAKITDLEAQLVACREKCRTLEIALLREQQSSTSKVETTERRLREVQEQMMCKMKECSQARDAQLALKTEIEAYKSLIEVEEQRLATTSSISHQQSSQSACSHYRPRRMPPINSGFVTQRPIITNIPTMSSLPKPGINNTINQSKKLTAKYDSQGFSGGSTANKGGRIHYA